MNKMLSVEEIRDAALQLKAKGIEPNCAQIARRVGKTKMQISYLVNDKYDGFGLEQFVVKSQRYTKKNIIYAELLRGVAKRISEEGNIVCLKKLAIFTGWTRRNLWEFFNKNPLLVQELSLESDLASDMLDAARKLVASGKAVTRLDLSIAAPCNYKTVYNFFIKHPHWIGTLGVVDASWGSGVASHLYSIKDIKKTRR